MDIKDRIKQIIQMKGISDTKFAEGMGVGRASLYQIFNGRNKPSLDIVMSINQTYGISLDWLLYGRGEMYINSSSSNTPSNSPSLKNTEKQLEIFNKNSINEYDSLHNEKKAKEIEEKHPILPTNATVIQEVMGAKITSKKIAEIRVYYSDHTFEIFKSNDY